MGTLSRLVFMLEIGGLNACFLRGYLQLSSSTDAVFSTYSFTAPNTYIFRIDSDYNHVWGKSINFAGGGGVLVTDSAESKVYMGTRDSTLNYLIEFNSGNGAYSSGFQA